jgi:intracellular sulfur oxidation DsrE/DsrF family protein
MKAILLSGLLALSATGVFAEGQTHKVAVHVDQNDPQVMNMALNNVANLISYYESQGDTAVVEVVAYGPGLNMFVADKSPVIDRISAMSLEHEGLQFSACANTIAGMEKKTGEKVALISEAVVVPSGVVQLVTLQEDGYAYVRP